MSDNPSDAVASMMECISKQSYVPSPIVNDYMENLPSDLRLELNMTYNWNWSYVGELRDALYEAEAREMNRLEMDNESFKMIEDTFKWLERFENEPANQKVAEDLWHLIRLFEPVPTMSKTRSLLLLISDYTYGYAADAATPPAV